MTWHLHRTITAGGGDVAGLTWDAVLAEADTLHADRITVAREAGKDRSWVADIIHDGGMIAFAVRGEP